MSKQSVRLGSNEELVMIGHDLGISVSDDDGTFVYIAEDWAGFDDPSFGFDEDGDLRRVYAGKLVGQAIPCRSARCPSERKRFERIFVRDFKDEMRIG